MRHGLIGLLMLVAIASLGAQEKFRARWASSPVETVPAVPKVTITSPTQGQAITVANAAFVLAGSAESSGLSPLSTVTWVNDRGGSGSATATAPGFAQWLTASGAGAQTVVLDDFTGASDINLASLNASPTGGAWTERENTTATGYIQRRAAGYIRASAAFTSGGSPRIIYTVEPAVAISGTNYDVQATVSQGTSDADAGNALIFGYADTSNYCAVMFLAAGAATDIFLLKREAGTVSTLASGNHGVTTGDVLTVSVRGTSLEVFKSGVSILTGTSSFCDNATGVGVGFGAFRGVATDDIVTDARFDDFTVVDQDASVGAITLQSGVNVITVTVTDAASNTATDTITVTLAVADTIDPEVTITVPVTESSQSTGTAAIVIGGTCRDNTACESVVLDCPECSPAVVAAACTLSGSGTEKTFVCESVTQAAGANALTVTAEDAEENDATDLLTSTLSTADVTAPVIAIKSNSPGDCAGTGTNFSTTTSPIILCGTATDAVGVISVTWTNDAGSPGTANLTPGTSVSWDGSVTLAPGVNNLTFTATDANGNAGTDTIAVTYTPTLTITTTTLPPATEDVAYSQTVQRTGGVAPFTFDNNGAGTTLNDGDAQCAGLTISSAGVVGGTPTETGTCSFTVRVTDDDAVTDTQPLSIVVQSAGAEGPHDYFAALIARSDCYKALSLRPDAGQTTAVSGVTTATRGVADCAHAYYANQLKLTNQGGYTPDAGTSSVFVTYDPDNDTVVEKQDAAKAAIPAFNSNITITLSAGVDATTTTIPVTPCGAVPHINGAGFRVDNEVMVISGTIGGSQCNLTVQRGAFVAGSNAAHSAGASVLRATNTLPKKPRVPIWTDGTISATYLITWDGFWTSSFLNVGLINQKSLQITGYDDTSKHFFELQTRFSPSATYGGVDFDPNTMVAAATVRIYTEPMPPSVGRDPVGPQASIFRIFPATWTRFWVLVEANAESDTTKFEKVTELAQAVADTTTTQIVIKHGSEFTHNPFTAITHVAGGSGANTWPGRALRIGSEIVTVTSGTTSGSTRILTVVRGANGSTPATHALNADVEAINDYFTLWMADENQAPVKLLDRMKIYLPTNVATTTARGSITAWYPELGTSTDNVLQGRADNDFEDLVAYLRNFAVLKNPADCSASDCAALLVKPVR